MDLLTKARLQQRGELYLLERAIEAASQGRFRSTEEATVWQSPDGNPQKIVVNWEDIGDWARRDARDLNVATSSAGGYLKDTATRPLQLALAGASRVIGGGAEVVVLGVAGDQIVPTVPAMPVFQWLPTETTQITSDATLSFGSVAAIPHLGGVYLKVSYRLSKQASIEEQLRRILIQVAALGIDYAALRGSGVSGQPSGLFNNANVPTTAGASANLSLLLTIEEALCAANVIDERITILTASNVRTKYRTREVASGSGIIWPEKTMLGHDAFATSALLAGSMVAGDFANLQILLWGKGPTILVDPFSGFQSGRLDFGLSFAIDTICTYPAAFYTATNLS